MSPLCVRYELLILALAAFLPLWTAARVTSNDVRKGRWMWGERQTVIETVRLTDTVERLTASSCYVLETNLPKCGSIRRRRDIKIDATPTVPILSTTAPVLEDIGGENALGALSSHRQSRQHADGFVLGNAAIDPSNDDQDIQYPIYGMTPGSDELNRYGRQAVNAAAAPEASVIKENVTVEDKGNSTLNGTKVEPTTMGWLEYFYLKAVTSTVTVHVEATKWYVDPSHMVTFSVRGCKPSTMPFDMAKCNDAHLGPKANVPIIDAGTPSNNTHDDATKSVTDTPVPQKSS